jgi:hypothetical protein
MTVKPKGLKKLHKNKTWRYLHQTKDIGIIDVYNFTLDMNKDVEWHQQAMNWCNEHKDE